MNYLNLVRYKNLIVIAIVELLMYYSIICPTLAVFGLVSNLSGITFWLLLTGTVLVAAGGYVINDYFDIKIDRINRPGKVVIGSSIEKTRAMRFYQVLTAAGILAGLACAATLRSMTIALIFILVPGMLWFYSASYKRQLVIGNIIVGLMAALVPLLPLIAEASALQNNYNDLIRQTPVLKMTYSYVCGFALFAFLLTIAREVVKDIDDMAGDREMECHTIAIVWGELWAKAAASSIIVITNALAALCVYLWMPLAGTISQHYFLFGIAAPSLCALIILWSKSCTAYRNTSILLKFIMCIGTFYSLIYYFILSQAYGIAFLGIFQTIAPN